MKTVAVSVAGAAALAAGLVLLRLRLGFLVASEPSGISLDRPLSTELQLRRLRELGM